MTAEKKRASISTLGLACPRVVAVLMLGIVIGGLVAFWQTPRREDPVVRGNGFTVQIYYPGADSGKVEAFAVKPVEKCLNEVDDIVHISSWIHRETAFIFCELDEEADIEERVADARKKLEEAQRDLPSVCAPAVLEEFCTGDIPVAVYGVGGSFNTEQLRDFSRVFSDTLKDVTGVAKVEIEGIPGRRVDVKLSSETLNRYGVDISLVLDQLGKRNLNIPGGRITLGRTGFLITTSNELSMLDDIRKTVVTLVDGKVPLTVQDLGKVGMTDEKRRFFVRIDGLPGFSVSVRSRRDADVFTLTRRIEKAVARVRRRLPPGVIVRPVVLQRDTTRRIVESFENNLLYGSLLVAVIVLIHLGARAAVVVLSAVPLSLLGSLIVLSLMGIKYHKVSVFSLVLVLGMLVDNAIVVVEGIERAYAAGGDPVSALSDACSGVASPLVASTGTTVAAFLPLFMMGGMVGGYIRDLPWVACVTLVCSLLVALFFTPVLAYWVLAAPVAWRGASPARPKDDAGVFGWLYGRFMNLAITLKYPCVALCVAAFIAAVAFIPYLGLELFPDTDRDHFVVRIKTPVSFGLSATNKVIERIEGLIRENSDCNTFLTYVGKTVPRFHYNIVRQTGENFADILVRVKDHLQVTGFIDYLRRASADIPDCRVDFERIVEGPYTGKPVALYVKSDDRASASRVADRLVDQLRSVRGAVDIDRDEYRCVPEFDVVIDEMKSKLLGVPGLTVSKTIRSVISGETATRFRPGKEKEYDVVVRLDDDGRRAVERLKTLSFVSPRTGARIPLGHIARIRFKPQLAFRFRRDGKPAFRVRCDVDGVLPDTIVECMKNEPSDFIPPDCAVEYGGETTNRDHSFKNLFRALLWALVLVFLILVSQFDSFLQTLVVLFTLPLAVIGAVVGLYATAQPFGFMAFLGIVALAGVVVNDAILLIDYINVLRTKGAETKDAIIQAGIARHRPIYLTTVTTIGGTLPLAVNGGSLWEPLGWVIVFGMASATLLTLLVIPLGYAIVERA